MHSLLDFFRDAQKQGATSGGEWAAPCPACGGEDRFRIWPEHPDSDTGNTWCRQCKQSWDGIAYAQEFEDMSFREAVDYFGVHRDLSDAPANHTRAPRSKRKADQEPPAPKGPRPWKAYEPPGDAWRSAAASFIEEAERRLWSDHAAAPSALRYLRGRGLTDDTIRSARLGLHPSNAWPSRSSWGLKVTAKRKTLWLPRGIVIPWFDASGACSVNIRRPNGDVKPEGERWEQRKYQRAAGPSAPLYGAPTVGKGKPVVLVEGEFDALAVRQEAGDLCSVVATGSTGGARRNDWLEVLSSAPAVLVAFDTEAPGHNAAETWLHRLPNAARWAPLAHDTADMLAEGHDLRLWIRMGIAGMTATSHD